MISILFQRNKKVAGRALPTPQGFRPFIKAWDMKAPNNPLQRFTKSLF